MNCIISHRQKLQKIFSKIGRKILATKYQIAALLFVATIFIPQLSSFAKAPLASAESHNVPVVTRSDAETYYLNAVNNLRTSKNLQPLIIDDSLNSSAMAKGADMNANNYWGHYSPNGTSFADFIWRRSPKADTVAENLARCFVTRQAVFEALESSPAHYEIMVGNFTNFGVAEVFDPHNGCTNVIMHFALYK